MKYKFSLFTVTLFFSILAFSPFANAKNRAHNKPYLKNNPNLPKWCYYTWDGNIDHPKTQELFRRYGPGWIHMHHYCRGLNWYQEALLEMDQGKRKFKLEQAINNFDYVLSKTDESFEMRPLVLLQKGQTLIFLDYKQLAIQNFQEAITLRPDYLPPYLALSGAYESSGSVRYAQDTLLHALKYFPDNKVVKRELKRINKLISAKKAK